MCFRGLDDVIKALQPIGSGIDRRSRATETLIPDSSRAWGCIHVIETPNSQDLEAAGL